jgi:hypothetical protein
MALEDKVQRYGEQLLQRLRQQTEQEVRGFVSELLTAAAKERASVLDDDRRTADNERQKAVREEAARVRADVEKTWAAKLSEANAAAETRYQSAVATEREQADRQLAEKVTSVRAEGQRVLEAALEAARQEADRTLALRVDQVREQAEQTVAAELGAAPLMASPEPAPAEVQTDEVLDRVLNGVRRLDQASRVIDALDTLAELAGNEAPRVAVLTVEDDRVRGWRFVGFGHTFDEARQVDLELGRAGIVGQAVVTGESRSVLSGPNGVPTDAEPDFTTLPAGVFALAVPVYVGGQVMAVVYGDDADRRPAPGWRELLEILARHAGHCLEAVTAARAAQLAMRGSGALMTGDDGPTLPFDDVPEAEELTQDPERG